MSSLNSCSFIGRLGKDPELKTMTNGNKVANFSMVCSESWKDKATGEKKEKTEWINCNAWGPLADVLGRYVHKGDLIYVNGKLTTRSYEKDGATRYVTEIVVGEMKMLGSKSQAGGAGTQGQAAWDPDGGMATGTKANTATNANDGVDDLPF